MRRQRQTAVQCRNGRTWYRPSTRWSRTCSITPSGRVWSVPVSDGTHSAAGLSSSWIGKCLCSHTHVTTLADANTHRNVCDVWRSCTHRAVRCGTHGRLHDLLHLDAELLAKPGEGVCIWWESGMLVDDIRHQHPSEVDIESLQPLG